MFAGGGVKEAFRLLRSAKGTFMEQAAASTDAEASRPLAARYLDYVRRRRLAHIHSTVEFRAAAARALPRMVFDYVDGGAGSEATVRANREALERVRLVPSAPCDVSACDLSMTLFGQRLAMPVVIGPTGLASASWPRGEIELARAAARHGIPFVLANATSVAPRDVAQAGSGHAWFQLYPPPDRELARKWVAIVRDCGFTAMEVTVDVAVPGLRMRDARNGFVMPFRWTPRKLLDVVTRPAWAVKMLYHGQPSPYLDVPGAKTAAATQSESRRHRFNRALSWDLLKILREEWKGPLIVKGLLDPRQARHAVEAGYDGIVVSNHGGRQLDGAVSALEMLPEFRQEVGGSIPLLVDGGFQSGTDILKAIALGASAVQLGRLPVYALATAGGAGVDRALSLLRAEIETGLALCGAKRPDELGHHSVRTR